MSNEHGSAFERGDSDAYYGRQDVPHIWLDGLGAKRSEDLTPDQREEYNRGFDQNPSGRKEWA